MMKAIFYILKNIGYFLILSLLRYCDLQVCEETDKNEQFVLLYKRILNIKTAFLRPMSVWIMLPKHKYVLVLA